MNIYILTNGNHSLEVAANDENEARNMVSLELEGSQEVFANGQSTHSSPWHSCVIELIERDNSDYTSFTIIRNNYDDQNQ